MSADDLVQYTIILWLGLTLGWSLRSNNRMHASNLRLHDAQHKMIMFLIDRQISDRALTIQEKQAQVAALVNSWHEASGNGSVH